MDLQKAMAVSTSTRQLLCLPSTIWMPNLIGQSQYCQYVNKETLPSKCTHGLTAWFGGPKVALTDSCQVVRKIESSWRGANKQPLKRCACVRCVWFSQSLIERRVPNFEMRLQASELGRPVADLLVGVPFTRMHQYKAQVDMEPRPSYRLQLSISNTAWIADSNS